MRRLILFILVAAVLIALVRSYLNHQESVSSNEATSSSFTSSSSVACVPVRLVFYSDTDRVHATFEHPITVTRCVSNVPNIADAALRSLFAGPTPEEEKNGALGSADLQALASSYLGVSVEQGIATVNFKKTALVMLNAAAARQMMAKAPIEATLKNLSGIKTVKYAIDGTVFEAWDA